MTSVCEYASRVCVWVEIQSHLGKDTGEDMNAQIPPFKSILTLLHRFSSNELQSLNCSHRSYEIS